MRTTLDLDDDLLAKARTLAKARGTTLTSVVEEALAQLVATRPSNAAPYRLRWKTHRGVYLGGADVADRQSLYDIMEDRR